MERLEFGLLFRWFVGLGIDDAVWDHSVFSKNRDRLLEGDIAAKFLNAVLAQPRVKREPQDIRQTDPVEIVEMDHRLVEKECAAVDIRIGVAEAYQLEGVIAAEQAGAGLSLGALAPDDR